MRLDFGAEVANLLARRLVVAPYRPGGQAQYVETPMPRHESCGLGAEANLRHHFARLLGVPPTEYRREFRRSAA